MTSEQSPELAQAQRAVLSPVYALVSCPGTPTSCVAQHVSEAEHALAGALRLARAEGASQGWALPGWPHEYHRDGIHMSDCRACGQLNKRLAELAAARAACEAL